MRKLFLLLIFINPSLVLGQSAIPADTDGVRIEQDNELMNDPIVQKSVQYCQALGKSDEKMGDCVWKHLQDNSPEKQKEIAEKYAPADSKVVTTHDLNAGDKDFGPNVKEKVALKKLKEFYKEKLQEALNEKNESGQMTKMASQSSFYALYEAQVGKNIITALSSFCIEAKYKAIDQETFEFTISDDREKQLKQREANIKNLQSFDPKTNGNTQAQKWNACIATIPKICHQKGHFSNFQTKEEYTWKRACEVTTYLENMRQALLAVGKIKKKFNQGTRLTGGTIGNEIRTYTGGQGEAGTHELTSIASGDLEGYIEGNKEDQANFEKCFTIDDQGKREVVDAKECEAFALMTEEEIAKKEEELKNLALETKAKEESINVLEADEEMVATHLQSQGFAEDSQEYKKIMEKAKASPDGYKKIMQEIKGRYKNKREALIAKMRDKLQDSQVSHKVDSTGTMTSNTEIKVKDKLEGIGQEIADDAEKFKQLIHYNNIVSGYLSIDQGADENGETQKKLNTASIKLELQNSAYNQEDEARAPSNSATPGPYQNSEISVSDTYHDDLEGGIKQNTPDYENQSDDNNNVTLGVNDLNKLLGYDL